MIGKYQVLQNTFYQLVTEIIYEKIINWVFFNFRAGRCQPGVCYHLFSSARFDAMMEYQLPEILRYPLQVYWADFVHTYK